MDDRTGVIFGTTEYGGGSSGIGSGTVFSLTPRGSGYTEHVLHWSPDRNGTMVGTTRSGGTSTTCAAGGPGAAAGCGTVFQFTP